MWIVVYGVVSMLMSISMGAVAGLDVVVMSALNAISTLIWVDVGVDVDCCPSLCVDVEVAIDMDCCSCVDVVVGMLSMSLLVSWVVVLVEYRFGLLLLS